MMRRPNCPATNGFPAGRSGSVAGNVVPAIGDEGDVDIDDPLCI
jgi:hypothetical protein